MRGARDGRTATGHVLLLGGGRDPVVALVREQLERLGHAWRIAPSLADLQLSVQLGDGAPRVALRFDDGLALEAATLRGVLLRTVSGLQPDGWHADDLPYAAAESRSALIGWLWSVACPVVNRPRPELWHRSQAGALAWHRELQLAGLAHKPHTVRCGEAVDVRKDLPAQALLATGTGAMVYDVHDEEAWERVGRLAAIVPVTLTPRHGDRAVACVADGAVTWAEPPAPILRRSEPGLARLAAVTGLGLFEVVVVAYGGRPCVESVDTWPRLDAFGDAARREIGARLVRALTRPAARALPEYEQPSARAGLACGKPALAEEAP